MGGNNSPTDLREEIARVDHQFSVKFSVFGHWISEQISQTYGTTQWSGDNVPSVANVFGNPSYSAVIHATYVISPTLLNEAPSTTTATASTSFLTVWFRLPADFTFNRLFTGPNVDNRIPSINLAGVTGSEYTSNWTPWNNKADDYQFRDDVSWTKGAHQLKFGFSWALYKKTQDAFANTEGNFTFNGSLHAVYRLCATILSRVIAQALHRGRGQDHRTMEQHLPGAYVQDNWRVNQPPDLESWTALGRHSAYL